MITSYEQARRLKEIGFNEETLFVFTPYLRAGERIYKLENGFDTYREHLKDWNDTLAQFSAPSISEALQWIMDNKGIDCYVELRSFSTTGGNRMYTSDWKGVLVKSKFEDYSETEPFDTYQEAESALLNELLDYLEGRGRYERRN